MGSTGKQGKNKADITWMSSSTSLSPSASPLLVPRQFCLGEVLFDATAGSAATAPPLIVVRHGMWDVTLPSSGCGSDPAPLPTCVLTLPVGSGSGLVSSSVPWDEFVGSMCCLRMRRGVLRR